MAQALAGHWATQGGLAERTPHRHPEPAPPVVPVRPRHGRRLLLALRVAPITPHPAMRDNHEVAPVRRHHSIASAFRVMPCPQGGDIVAAGRAPRSTGGSLAALALTGRARKPERAIPVGLCACGTSIPASQERRAWTACLSLPGAARASGFSPSREVAPRHWRPRRAPSLLRPGQRRRAGGRVWRLPHRCATAACQRRPAARLAPGAGTGLARGKALAPWHGCFVLRRRQPYAPSDAQA